MTSYSLGTKTKKEYIFASVPQKKKKHEKKKELQSYAVRMQEDHFNQKEKDYTLAKFELYKIKFSKHIYFESICLMNL